MESLISIAVALIVLGLVMYLVENFLPLSEPFRLALRVVVVLALILWILRASGLWSGHLAL
jgi:hypothetical protein